MSSKSNNSNPTGKLDYEEILEEEIINSYEKANKISSVIAIIGLFNLPIIIHKRNYEKERGYIIYNILL